MLSCFKYKLLAPAFSGLLLFRPRFWAWASRKTGFDLVLSLLVVWLFRREAVSGVNLFSPPLYRQMYPAAPGSPLASLLHHLRRGEAEGLNPTYFFDTVWFTREYAHILPKGASPLVFFLLQGRRQRLKPHWNAVFWGAGLRLLRQEPDGRLTMSERQSLADVRLAGLDAPPPSGIGWAEIDIRTRFKVSDWCETHGAPVKTTYRSEPERVAGPAAMPGSPALPGLVKVGYPAYLARLADVTAIGGETALRLPDGSWIRDGNVDSPADGLYHSLGLGLAQGLDKGRIRVWRRRELAFFRRGILLMQPVDFNYFHWLIEALPRLLPLLDDGEFSGYPVFITAGMPASHEEALRLLVPDNHLIRVERHIAFKVGEAIYPSEINRYYLSADGVVRNRDARLDLGILRNLRERLLAAIPPEVGPKRPDRIFIHRGNYRVLKNQREIYRLAMDRGFEIVRPELLPFAEQVTLFRQARDIIVPAGAGVANIMFASPEARIGVIGQPGPGNGFSMWLALAAVAGASLHALPGVRAFDIEYVNRDNILLPLRVLSDFLARTGLDQP